MKHKYLVAGTAFVAFLIVLSAIYLPQIGSGADQERAVTESYVVESPHNYPDNYDNIWTINVPGAEWIKVHFYRYDVEKRYDYVHLYDENGVRKASYTGLKYNIWSTTIYGETVYVRLISDYSVTKWGFKIDQIQYEGAAPPPTDTTPPTVAITAPSNGATIDGDVTVAISASDNVGVTGRYLSIDNGAYFAVGTTYTWDTTTVADGAHTLKAKAVDAAGNEGFSSTVNVVVENEEEPPPPPEEGDAHFIGAVAGSEIDWYQIVAYPGLVSVSVSWTGSYDIDCYICESQSYTTYLARGYTTANPETCSWTVPTTYPDGKTLYIGVRMYTSSAPSTTYDCHVTWETSYEPPPPPPPPSGDKWAIVVGISDYKAISDLSYCDEDATDWYNYLIGLGYGSSNIRVLGDGHTSNYPAYYAYATEYNYRACLQWVADNCDTGDVVNFLTSGHGSGDGRGSSFLCAWDCNSGESGYDGSFYDTEIDDYINAIASKGALVHVFIDHCYSGGIGPELMAIGYAGNVYCTTTCSDSGYGYDDSAHQNGMWTYWFLEAGLIGQFGSSASTTMEACFDWASANYNHSGGDAPMEFDGSSSSSFTL
jgi:hypothetical protein